MPFLPQGYEATAVDQIAGRRRQPLFCWMHGPELRGTP
jgi:hypothetical protein